MLVTVFCALISHLECFIFNFFFALVSYDLFFNIFRNKIFFSCLTFLSSIPLFDFQLTTQIV